MGKYFMIRKAEGQLRSKVYRMLQEELVRAPIMCEASSGLDECENEEVPDAVKEGGEVIGADEGCLEDITNNSRPRRKSADKAREMFKKTLYVQDDLGRVFKLSEILAAGNKESFFLVLNYT